MISKRNISCYFDILSGNDMLNNLLKRDSQINVYLNWEEEIQIKERNAWRNIWKKNCVSRRLNLDWLLPFRLGSATPWHHKGSYWLLEHTPTSFQLESLEKFLGRCSDSATKTNVNPEQKITAKWNQLKEDTDEKRKARSDTPCRIPQKFVAPPFPPSSALLCSSLIARFFIGLSRHYLLSGLPI